MPVSYVARSARTVALVAWLLTVQMAAADQFTIVQLSDIHYDMYYGTDKAYHPKDCSTGGSTYGTPGCDSPKELAVSAVEDIARHVLASSAFGPVVVLYTGDYLRHHMDHLSEPLKDARSMFSYLIDLFHERLTASSSSAQQQHSGGAQRQNQKLSTYADHQQQKPSSPSSRGVLLSMPVVAMMGNEDFYPSYTFNYTTGSAILQSVAIEMQQKGYLTSNQVADFSRCAYTSFNATIPRGGGSGEMSLRFINLNSLLYSVQLLPGTDSSDPCHQFWWLRSELLAARELKQRVYIVGHIPPAKHFWYYSYLATYESILSEFQDVIAAQLFGHTHRLSFGAMGGSSSTLAPMFIAGGITRKDYSNPQYSIMTADARTGEILTLQSRYLSPKLNGEWVTGGELSQVLGIPNLNISSLYSAGQSLVSDNNATFTPFFVLHEGGVIDSGVTCGRHCRNKIACDTIAFTKEQLDNCLIS